MNPIANTPSEPSGAVIEAMARLHMHGIARHEIPPMWDQLQPIMERAEGYFSGRSDTMHIIHECMMGRMQLWVIGDTLEDLTAAIVTQIVVYPRRRVCRYMLVAGDAVDSWLDMDEVVVEWAKQQGATMIETAARTGWKPRLKKRGYTSKMSIFEREI